MTEMIFPVREMASRSMRNLQAIETRKVRPADKYEVTQLISSFLCVYAFPRETWADHFNDIRFDSERGSNWPRLEPLDPRDKECRTVGDLVRLVRNAFAHQNFNFTTTNGEITGLRIWNTDPETKLRTWASEVDIRTLKLLLYAMCNEIKELDEPEMREFPSHHADHAERTSEYCVACGKTLKPGNVQHEQFVASLKDLQERSGLTLRKIQKSTRGNSRHRSDVSS